LLLNFVVHVFATGLNNLAVRYDNQGRYADAEALEAGMKFIGA
jgi:hypothetical protein